MDGYALAREPKKPKPELPIIISSGFGYADATSFETPDDRAGFIAKPYNLAQLRDVLRGVPDHSPHE
jgi:DNA-binding NtrC family response regulator